MTDKHCLKVLSMYRKFLIWLKAEPIEADYDSKHINKTQALNHLFSMLKSMEDFIKENQKDKFFRWLGFMQGVLWLLGAYSLNELREHNRPPK